MKTAKTKAPSNKAGGQPEQSGKSTVRKDRWSCLKTAGATFLQILSGALSFLLNRREFTIWPMMFGLVMVLLAGAIFLATGSAVIASLDPLFACLLDFVIVVAVVALVGAMKTNGYLISDIENENDHSTPWQKVAFSDLCAVLLIVGISWLLLS